MRFKPSNITFALRHPRQAALVVMYGNRALLWDQIAGLAAASDRATMEIFNEISSGSTVERHVRETLRSAGGECRAEVGFRDEYCLYTICRLVRPKTVVETGVAAGVSSAFILQALDKNSTGSLYSIDLPRYENYVSKQGNDCPTKCEPRGSTIPRGMKPGFVIPDGLKGRWNLDLGPNSELLPKVLDRVGEADLFFHDTEHTYQNMTFEFETAWPKISDSGLLLAHGVDRNSAFLDFGRRNGIKPAYLRGTRLGGLRK